MMQVGFKRELIKEVEVFKADARAFRTDWELHGPMVPGLDPTEAVDRLKKFMQMFEVQPADINVITSRDIAGLVFLLLVEIDEAALTCLDDSASLATVYEVERRFGAQGHTCT